MTLLGLKSKNRRRLCLIPRFCYTDTISTHYIDSKQSIYEIIFCEYTENISRVFNYFLK